MRRAWNFGRVDQQAAAHAEVDEKLCGLFGASGFASEVEGDGLAYAVDAVDARVGEGLGDKFRRRLKGLGLVAGLDAEDGLAARAGVDSVGYGFYFGEFGHLF